MARTEDSVTAKAAQNTAQAAQQATVDPVDVALPEPLTPVPVRSEAPALVITSNVSLSSANPVLPLLPQDPRRRSATVLAVSEDVWVCHSLELAQAAQGQTSGPYGFYWPTGVALPPITAKGALWVAWTGMATVVSVLVEKDDE